MKRYEWQYDPTLFPLNSCPTKYTVKTMGYSMSKYFCNSLVIPVFQRRYQPTIVLVFFQLVNSVLVTKFGTKAMKSSYYIVSTSMVSFT